MARRLVGIIARVLWRWLTPYRAWRLRRRARRVYATMRAEGVTGDELLAVAMAAGVETDAALDAIVAEAVADAIGSDPVLRKLRPPVPPPPRRPLVTETRITFNDGSEIVSDVAIESLEDEVNRRRREAMAYIESKRGADGLLRITSLEAAHIGRETREIGKLQRRLSQKIKEGAMARRLERDYGV